MQTNGMQIEIEMDSEHTVHTKPVHKSNQSKHIHNSEGVSYKEHIEHRNKNDTDYLCSRNIPRTH